MIGSRLRSLREKHHMTQERVSKVLGVTRPAYTQYESGSREPDADTLAKLADLYEVSTDYLITGESHAAPLPDNVYPVGVIKQVPIVAEIACGEPTLTEDNVIGYHPVDTSIVNLNSGEHVWVRAKGDSMIGSNIMDGSLVLLRLQPEVENGQIAAVCVDNESATIKRVFFGDGTVTLNPDNPTMRSVTYPKGRVRIVALAIRVSSELT